MSRTIRRNEEHLLKNRVCGNDYYGQPYHPWKYEHLPLEVARILSLRHYMADSHSGRYHPPAWWRKLHYVRPERRAAKCEIKRCMDQGSFDDHLDLRLRGVTSTWHWERT